MKMPYTKVSRKILMIFLVCILISISLFQNVLALDSDGDGLTDDEEIKFRTNPNDADSDDDGVLDGDEKDWNKDTDGKGDINAKDPDSDDDGIYDGTEMGITTPHNDTKFDGEDRYFIADTDGGDETTSMVDRDTDGDHKSDGDEDKNRNGKYEPLLGETDPNVADFDEDGIEDSEDDDIDGDRMPNEFENLFGFDNYNPDDAEEDEDGDGFTNLREFRGDDDQDLPNVKDWSDPTDPTSQPDLAPKVEFSRPRKTEEANQTITIDKSILNVSDSVKDEEAGLTYIWDWGDGKKDTDTQVINPKEFKRKHIYEKRGTYILTLKVVDPHNNDAEDTIEVVITTPIGQHGTIIDVDREPETFKDKITVRRKGWVAYKIINIKNGDKITFEFELTDLAANRGLRIFVIPAKNLEAYTTNDPNQARISHKYDKYWMGHISNTEFKGKIEIDATSEEDILIILDNGFYQEYIDVVKTNVPIETKVTIHREASPFLMILFLMILIVIIVIAIVGIFIYKKLKDTKGMTKITREAAVETQRSLDREMVQLELEIQDSMRRGSFASGPMTAMPMQPPPSPTGPPGSPGPGMGPPGVGVGAQPMSVPGTVPQTPTPITASTSAPGQGPQLPGAAPAQPGTQPQLTPVQAPGTAPGQTGQVQMLPPASPGAITAPTSSQPIPQQNVPVQAQAPTQTRPYPQSGHLPAGEEQPYQPKAVASAPAQPPQPQPQPQPQQTPQPAPGQLPGQPPAGTQQPKPKAAPQ